MGNLGCSYHFEVELTNFYYFLSPSLTFYSKKVQHFDLKEANSDSGFQR